MKQRAQRSREDMETGYRGQKNRVTEDRSNVDRKREQRDRVTGVREVKEIR